MRGLRMAWFQDLDAAKRSRQFVMIGNQMNLRDALSGDQPHEPKPIPASEWIATQAHLDQTRAGLRDILRREQPWRCDLNDPDEWAEFESNH